jgi:membrane protease YdiL (CAAX protease family)
MTSKVAKPAWAPPVSWLPRALMQPRRPLRVLLIAWATALIPSVLIGAAVGGLLPDLPQPKLTVGTPLTFALAVIISPILETLIMAAVLRLLLIALPPTAAVAVSAIAWGIAHSLAAPAWGLVIWWPFLVFSVLFVTWRERSLAAALAMPAATHALHNLLPALALLAGARG